MKCFNYPNFIEELRNDPEKRGVVLEYERLVGSLGKKPIRNIIDAHGYEISGSGEKWFTDLVRHFPAIEGVKVPEGMENDFDWELLVQLGVASLAADLGLKRSNDEIHLYIKVKSGDQVVVKKLHELWGFQILRLFEIWIAENIGLCVLCYEKEEEKLSIYEAKNNKLHKWHFQLDKIYALI